MSQAPPKSRASYDYLDVKTTTGVKSGNQYELAEEHDRKRAEDLRADRASKHLHNVYHVDYVIRNAPLPPAKRLGAKGEASLSAMSRSDAPGLSTTVFDPPQGVSTGSIRLVAASDLDLHKILALAVPVGKGQTLEISSSRVLASDVIAHPGAVAVGVHSRRPHRFKASEPQAWPRRG